MSDIVFLDCETTGLALDDHIWEIAAIRRRPDGVETRLHMFIDHDYDKCALLPPSSHRDHLDRWDRRHSAPPEMAAKGVAEFLAGKPHIVGAVPNFDTERLARLLHKFGHEPPWHYHLIDVENLAVGWLHGRYGINEEAERRAVALPWDSDHLALACGIDAQPDGARHTAMGDAEWVRAWYDHIVPVAALPGIES